MRKGTTKRTVKSAPGQGSGRRGMPGPLRRVLRQPLRAIAILLLAVTALAAAGVQSAAAMALQATLDARWRGAYDILVTPHNAFGPLGGMLPPNTLSASGGGMSLGDLERLRSVNGIEVAAPIGEILAPGLKWAFVRVVIPRHTLGAEEDPQAYRVTASYTTDDGFGERLVWEGHANIVVDERPDKDDNWQDSPFCLTEGTVNGYEWTKDEYPAIARSTCGPYSDNGADGVYQSEGGDSSSWQSDENAELLYVQLAGSPQTVTRITLVDPEAERELLGSRGAFLDPLIEVDPGGDTSIVTMTAWATRVGGSFAKRFLDDRAIVEEALAAPLMAPEVLADFERLYEANGDVYDQTRGAEQDDLSVVPILVAEDAIAELTVKINVEAFGAAVPEPGQWFVRNYRFPAGLLEGEPGASLGTSVADLSAMLNPFSAQSPAVAWPGTDLTAAENAPLFNFLSFQALGGVVSSSYRQTDEGIVLSPLGYRSPQPSAQYGDFFSVNQNPTLFGVESAFTTGTSKWLQGESTGQLGAVPVGSFSAEGLVATEAEADYVPLGAYEPVGSKISGGEHPGVQLKPSLNGMGLVSTRTAAIASLASAELWDDTAPISAVRVRVAGISDYSTAAQAEVVRVAAAIESLGFTATIVAGSSPSDVNLLVDGYAFGTDSADKPQSVGELGAVTQRWSELGAAARVELSVSGATLAILGTALLSSVLLLGAVQFAGVAARREQTVTMREVGLAPRQIVRWYAAEELPALLIVGLVTALALWISGGTQVAVIAASVAVTAVLLCAVVSVVLGARPEGLRALAGSRSRRTGARSAIGFGIRQVRVHPFTSLIQVVSIVVVGLSAAALCAALVTGVTDAGASSLAGLIVGQQLIPQLALGITGIAAGVLLARLTRRIDLARRAEQWATLRAAGWTSEQRSAAQRAEGAAILIPALAVTGVLAVAGALWLDLDPFWLDPIRLYPAVACIAGLLTAAVAFGSTSRGTSS